MSYGRRPSVFSCEAGLVMVCSVSSYFKHDSGRSVREPCSVARQRTREERSSIYIIIKHPGKYPPHPHTTCVRHFHDIRSRDIVYVGVTADSGLDEKTPRSDIRCV